MLALVFRDIGNPSRMLELVSTVKYGSKMIDLFMEQELKIKDILKDLMKKRGETLLSVSQHTGVPKSTIADWMTNRTPNPVQVVKIAKYFEVSLYFLLFGCEDPLDGGNKMSLDEVLNGRFEIDIRRIKQK